MCKILSRIKEFSVLQNIPIGTIERTIGASKGVLSRAIATGKDIQSKWLVSLVENYPQLSAEWLLTGIGNPLKGEDDSKVTPSPLYIKEFLSTIQAQAEEIGVLKERLKAYEIPKNSSSTSKPQLEIEKATLLST